MEHAIRSWTTVQHGVVTRAQLLAAGLTGDAIDGLLRAGRLRRLYRGVYLADSMAAPYTPCMAAVLAVGGDVLLSHGSAGTLWFPELPPADEGAVHVTVTAAGVSTRARIHVHRTRKLASDERARLHGMPITSPARTLIDLAGVLASRDLEQALALVVSRGQSTVAELASLADRHRRRPGVVRLRALLERTEGPAFTRSKAEDLFLDLVRKAQLRQPQVNARIDGCEVDFLWRAERLVVEIDGFEFHRSREQFESDRRRDARLTAAGLRVVRVTWRQLTAEPEATLVRLAQALLRGEVRRPQGGDGLP